MQLFLLLFILTTQTWAYQASLSSSGYGLHWVNPTIPLAINSSTKDLSASDVRTIIESSMNQWNLSSSTNIYRASSSNNEIRFASNFPYGSAVLGVTEISYNNAGSIQRASIILNDDYYFHSSPGFYPPGEVFLGDVVSHEMGHLLGLSHSEVLNSSMFYSSFPGQSTLSLDDKSGGKSHYDSGHGTISGFIKGGNSIGVLGAHVQAISRNTGESVGAISNENGFFEIGGLDLNDTYYIYTSPIRNPNSLPALYSNVQDKFCPGSFVGSLFSACGRQHDGKPTGITLTAANPSIDVGTISISCSLRSDQDYDLQKLQTTFAPIEIFNYGTEQKNEKAFVGWFRKSTGTAWSQADKFLINLADLPLSGMNPKYLKLSLVSYPFGTQLEYQMTVKQNGTALSSASRGISYSTLDETYNTDFYVHLPLSSSPENNLFEVNISSRKLSSSYTAQTFPSFSQFTSDAYLPYLMVASIYESGVNGMMPILDNLAYLSDNESCLDAPFTFAVAKAQSPISSSQGEIKDQTVAAVGCGTIEPPGDGPGSSSFPLLTLGFFLTMLASSLIKGRKNFLS